MKGTVFSRGVQEFIYNREKTREGDLGKNEREKSTGISISRDKRMELTFEKHEGSN